MRDKEKISKGLTFQYLNLIEKIKKDFKIDYHGDHGINHWQRVYANTQTLSKYYNMESEVFELFALLHDSKRENETIDKHHGLRASLFVKALMEEGVITLSSSDADRLIYACANHTHSDKKHPLFYDRVVQICFDSDRLDIGRVGYDIDTSYLATDYAKSLVVDGVFEQY